MHKSDILRKLISKILKLEHRKHRRVKVFDAVFIVFDPNEIYGDELIDLSMGGMSFSYIDEGEGHQFSKVFELDIQARDGFQLGKVKAEIISDTVVADFVEREKRVRRIGVRFLNLTPVQEYDLKKFLEKHQH